MRKIHFYTQFFDFFTLKISFSGIKSSNTLANLPYRIPLDRSHQDATFEPKLRSLRFFCDFLGIFLKIPKWVFTPNDPFDLTQHLHVGYQWIPLTETRLLTPISAFYDDFTIFYDFFKVQPRHYEGVQERYRGLTATAAQLAGRGGC